MDYFDQTLLITESSRQLECTEAEIAEHIIARRSEIMGIHPPSLEEIEEKYRQECAQRFGVQTWNEIAQLYAAQFELSIQHFSWEDQHILREQENRRYELAKFLQLNKFLATKEEILIELARLGINVFREQ